jgi:hypothetical protein
MLMGSTALSLLAVNGCGRSENRGFLQVLLGGAIVRADTWRKLTCCLLPAPESVVVLLGSITIFQYLALAASADGMYATVSYLGQPLMQAVTADQTRAYTAGT